MSELTVKTIREMAAQIKSVAIKPVDGYYTFLRDGIYLTVDDVVLFPGGMMHLQTFRNIAGVQAYNALLARPRVPNPYGEKH